MKRVRLLCIRNCCSVLLLSTCFAGCANVNPYVVDSKQAQEANVLLGVEDANKPLVHFQEFALDRFRKQNSTAMVQLVDIQSWPITNVWRVAPVIDKSLLSRPEIVTNEHNSFGVGPFKSENGGVRIWECRRKVKNEESLPTELPSDRVESFMRHLPPERRNDPNFIKKFLSRKLEAYRKSKMYRIAGELNVRICVAPDSRSAEEYLILQRSSSNMPIEMVANFFSEANRVEDLGTIGFSRRGLTMFIRDNVATCIRGHGEFAKESLGLGRKIDALIREKPALTYEQLLSRRPVISIGPQVDTKTKAIEKQAIIPYKVSVPAGQEVVSVRVFVDDHQHPTAPAQYGKICLNQYLWEKKTSLKVKITAVSSELLVNTAEAELFIEE